MTKITMNAETTLLYSEFLVLTHGTSLFECMHLCVCVCALVCVLNFYSDLISIDLCKFNRINSIKIHTRSTNCEYICRNIENCVHAKSLRILIRSFFVAYHCGSLCTNTHTLYLNVHHI